MIDFDGQSHAGQHYLQNVIEQEIIMAGNPAQHPDEEGEKMLTGLKAITIAYRDFNKEEFLSMML